MKILLIEDDVETAQSIADGLSGEKHANDYRCHQIDDSVSSEVGEILADSEGKGPESVRSVVQGYRVK
jgi:DNA-binding response OmpR family regulator